jgi:hypothetical protein
LSRIRGKRVTGYEKVNDDREKLNANDFDGFDEIGILEDNRTSPVCVLIWSVDDDYGCLV